MNLIVIPTLSNAKNNPWEFFNALDTHKLVVLRRNIHEEFQTGYRLFNYWP